MKKKHLTGLILSLVILLGCIALGYTQFAKKDKIIAHLQYQINLENSSGVVYAVLAEDQKLHNSGIFLKGSRIFGMTGMEDGNFVIYFDSIQQPGNKKTNFAGKVKLVANEVKSQNGISSRLGKTINQQARSTVLGAIFNTGSVQEVKSKILPRGSILNIEVE